jgi:hypothetical protein
MLLDNLFSMLGQAGTMAALFGILAAAGVPAASAVACPVSGLRRLQPRGR